MSSFQERIAQQIECDKHILQGKPYKPTGWQGHWIVIDDKIDKLVDTVSRYSGIGWWYICNAEDDGVAVVLVYKDGRRIFLTAKEFCITDKLETGNDKPTQLPEYKIEGDN